MWKSHHDLKWSCLIYYGSVLPCKVKCGNCPLLKWPVTAPWVAWQSTVWGEALGSRALTGWQSPGSPGQQGDPGWSGVLQAVIEGRPPPGWIQTPTRALRGAGAADPRPRGQGSRFFLTPGSCPPARTRISISGPRVNRSDLAWQPLRRFTFWCPQCRLKGGPDVGPPLRRH